MAVSITPNKTDITLNAANNYIEPILLTISGLTGIGNLTLYVTTDPQNPILEWEITANTRFGTNIRYYRQLEQYFTDRTQIGISIRIVDTNSVATAALNVTLDAPPIISLPTITTNWTDGTSIIAGVTNVTAAFTVTPQLGATITNVSGNIGLEEFFSYDSDGDNAWSGTAPASSIIASSSILIQATDSRGKTATYNASLNVRDHQPPVIMIEAFRCDSNGDKAMNGGYLSVTAWAASDPAVLGIDTLTMYVSGSSVIENDTPINSGQTYIIGNGTIDPDDIYDVRIDAEDNYGVSTYKLKTLAAVVRALNVRDEVMGIAFGKLATEDNLLDSAWDINTDGNYLKGGVPVMSQINSPSSQLTANLTVPNSSMHLVVFHSASTVKQGAVVVTCLNGTVYVQTLALGSDLTITTGTNRLTVTKATGVQVLIGDLVFRGGAIT